MIYISAIIIGAIAILEGLILFTLIVINNPSMDVFQANFLMEVVPAIIAILAIYKRISWIMVFSFIISLPIGIYVYIGSTNYIKYFVTIPIFYIIATILLSISKQVKDEANEFTKKI